MASGSVRAAQAALLGVIVIFVAVVAAGWHRLLLPTVAGNLEPLAWALGIGIAVIAVLLARAVAAERVELARGHRSGTQAWWACFVMLFVISALGTMNTVFYYGEGRLLLTENIDKADACLDRVEGAMSAAVATPDYDDKKARVDQLWVKLEAELTNPVRCGKGPVARGILAELRDELPAFTDLSGGGDCGSVPTLIPRYKEIIERQLVLSNEYRDDRVAEKRDFAKQMAERIRSNRDRLTAMKGGLGVGSIDDAKKAVEDVATTVTAFEGRVTRLGRTAQSRQAVKCDIQIDAVRGLGSPSQILPLLLGRLDRVSTFLYVAAAILADIVLIVCFIAVLRRDSPPDPGPRQARTGPKLLWVNPPR